MKQFNINTLLSKLSLLALIAILALSSGCNKEIEPIILTGNWDLDTAGVMVYIIYNPNIADEYPATVEFLEKNLQTIRRELMKPQGITFKNPNIAEFTYNQVPLPVEGTFVQDNALFTITNDLFPKGISGASDNLRLELYYSHEYLMEIIYRLITENDDSTEVYDKLIEKFEGVGAYKIGK